MKMRLVFLILLASFFNAAIFGQSVSGEGSDAQAAQQYVIWAQKEIDAGRWQEARAGLQRAADFAKVSSDISYLLAVTLNVTVGDRNAVIEALDAAIETNLWVSYSENHALLFKAQQLLILREYSGALACLDRTAESADALMLRLCALRGLALGNAYDYDPVQALARFRSLLLSAMDRYPRDPRPLRIFFEYARNRRPASSELPSGDINLLELALRRLPFLLESDPDLAWMAAPFMRNTQDARRYVSAYRSGGLPAKQVENFRPIPASIPVALNLGLIDDTAAILELFYQSGAVGELILNKEIVMSVFDLLRGEQGRDLLTEKLLSFSGSIFSDEDGDGYNETTARYVSGVIVEFGIAMNQNGIKDLVITYSSDGTPAKVSFSTAANQSAMKLDWERYPSVQKVETESEVFLFRPADFQYAPVTFIELGGSRNHTGLYYPVPSYQHLNITRRALVSFCSSIIRPSVEFDGAQEQIFLERAIPLRSVETLNGNEVSVTEFENGIPVVQRLDLDLDGRMETIRRFRRPGPDFPRPDLEGKFDFRSLIASSQSDWTGEGRFETGEVYLPDGSVVYSWDMDGSGSMNYSETEPGKE
jgi:tetratricopeptide (TPR) repeat protein